MILRLLAAGVILLALTGLWLRPAPEWRFDMAGNAATVGTGASFETVFAYTSPEGTAHAPAIVNPGAGAPQLVWFDGIRESHNDVRILAAPLIGGTVEPVLTRQALSQAMVPRQTVLTLGNTISDGQGGLLATIVSLGGWAASSVAAIAPDGTGRKLNLSPILNRSHLVKSPVLPMQGGYRMLPTYFEMGAAYGVAALIDDAGRVRGQAAMFGASPAIQPLILPVSETEAIALLRRFGDAPPFVHMSRTRDGGRSWSALHALDLPNPDAPLAGVRLPDGRLLILLNDAPDRADTLAFAVSDDAGMTWRMTRPLDGPGKGDLRYPMMAVLADGRIAVTYSTGSKASIVAHILSADWALGE